MLINSSVRSLEVSAKVTGYFLTHRARARAKEYCQQVLILMIEIIHLISMTVMWTGWQVGSKEPPLLFS